MSELGHLAFNKRVSQLLYGTIDEGLVGVSHLEDPLSKRIEGGLRTVMRSSSQLDGEDGVTFSHGKVGSRTNIVDYESYEFGFPFVVVSVVDGCRDTEPPI